MNYLFSHDDPRLGLCEETGAIKSWPALDITGAVYDKRRATTKIILGCYIIVIPPGMDRPDNDYMVAPAPDVKPDKRKG